MTQFGFSAVACDHDDPFDTAPKTDFSDEVAAFSNLNQICPTGSVLDDRDRLQSTAALFDPLIYIEPVFFDPATGQPRPASQADALWSGYQQSIAQSGVPDERITFYLFDEPTLRGVPLASLAPYAARIRDAYPAAKIMLIEAYSATVDPVVPDYVDQWGFNAYTLLDPAAEPLYGEFLDKAAAQMREGQSIVIIGDGIHTPFHTAVGLNQTDMAAVAQNYLNFAQSRDDVSAIIVYTWAGGIDNDQERGVRDLPVTVQEKWREIGRSIVQK